MPCTDRTRLSLCKPCLLCTSASRRSPSTLHGSRQSLKQGSLLSSSSCSFLSAWQVGTIPFQGLASSLTEQTAWIQLWGTIAALPSRKALVTLPHSRKATNTFIRRKASKGSQLGRFALCLRLPSIRPSFANVLFVSIPPLMSITSFVVAEMAGKELAKLRETWSAADSLLATAASDGWTPAGLAAIRVALTQMQTIHFTLAKRLRMTAVLYVLWVSLDCVVSSFATFLKSELIRLATCSSTSLSPVSLHASSRNSFTLFGKV